MFLIIYVVVVIIIRSSRADTKFDTTVGHIEDIIMGK